MAAAILVCSGSAAYYYQNDYRKNGEDFNNTTIDYDQIRRDSLESARIALREMHKCLEKDPDDWCNRDLTFQDQYKISYQFNINEFKPFYTQGFTNKQRRNKWLLIFVVTFIFLVYRAKAIINRDKNKRITTGY